MSTQVAGRGADSQNLSLSLLVLGPVLENTGECEVVKVSTVVDRSPTEHLVHLRERREEGAHF